MIGFFPPLYKEELLYSALARFHKRSGNISYKDTMMNLFDKKTISAVTDFPANLYLLCKRIEQRPEDIIDNHTLFPYYSPFISERVGEKIREKMINADSNSISLSLGISASKVKGPDHFRYCMSCYKEEVKLYGEAYWHRTHQVPGVYYCNIHNELLYISNVPYRNKKNKHVFNPLDEICIQNGKQVIISDQYHKYLLFIAEQTYSLLNSKKILFGIEKYNKYYISQLGGINYLTPSKRIRFQELLPNFLNYFPEGLLRLLDSEFDEYSMDTWFHKLLRKPKVVCHPLRHLIVLSFLNKEIPVLSNESSLDTHFFGISPWPCLNKASSHYKENIITNCTVTRDFKTGKPVGSFKCKSCGFLYSRKGPDCNEDDRYKIGRVKEFGPVWTEKLRNMYSSGKYSIREISRVLGVDSKTVNKYANSKSNGIKIKHQVNTNETLKYNRNVYLKLRDEYPDYSITELRKLNPTIYKWLYKNDNNWFINNLPPSRTRNRSRKLVDWGKRDDEYSLLIIEEAINLYIELPLVRVTKTKIYQRLDLQARFENNINKMPISKSILLDVVETVEEFQIRRIRFYSEQLRQSRGQLMISKLMRAAGIKTTSNKHIEEILHEEINK